MAVTLIGADGLFTRLGKTFNAQSVIDTSRGTTFDTEINDVIVEYDGDTNTIRNTVSGLGSALASAQSGLDGLMSSLQTSAKNTVIEMVHADSPLPSKTLAEAIKELIYQMGTGTTHYVTPNAPTSASVAGSANVGDGQIIVNVKDSKGYTLQYSKAEVLDVICTNNDTDGAEIFTVQGEAAPSSSMSHLWPAGSGASLNVTAANASSASNKLTNGNFETFTVANTPDNWTITAGVVGTDIKENAITYYAGGNALEFVGGGTAPAITQNVTVTARTHYALSFWLKADVVPAAGVLTFDLYDGTSVITDEKGTALSYTFSLPMATTSWVAHSSSFPLPDPLPSTVTFRIRTTTGISAGTSIFLDEMLLQPMASVYVGGPKIAIAGGATTFAIDDRFAVTQTNAYLGQFQYYFQRNFDMNSLGLMLPTTGTTLVNNSLIA